MSPPPDEHRAEVMRPLDDPTTFALNLVRTEMGRRFDGLEKRLDSMVTRDVHDATVLRLEAADAQQRRDLDAHKRENGRDLEALARSTEERFSKVESSVKSGDQAITSRLDREHEERKKTRRWLIGTAIAMTAVALSAVAIAVSVFI